MQLLTMKKQHPMVQRELSHLGRMGVLRWVLLAGLILAGSALMLLSAAYPMVMNSLLGGRSIALMVTLMNGGLAALGMLARALVAVPVLLLAGIAIAREVQSGGWDELRLTPLAAGDVVLGKAQAVLRWALPLVLAWLVFDVLTVWARFGGQVLAGGAADTAVTWGPLELGLAMVNGLVSIPGAALNIGGLVVFYAALGLLLSTLVRRALAALLAGLAVYLAGVLLVGLLLLAWQVGINWTIRFSFMAIDLDPRGAGQFLLAAHLALVWMRFWLVLVWRLGFAALFFWLAIRRVRGMLAPVS